MTETFTPIPDGYVMTVTGQTGPSSGGTLMHCGRWISYAVKRTTLRTFPAFLRRVRAHERHCAICRKAIRFNDPANVLGR